MNRIEIENENVTLLDSDEKIVVTLSSKLDVFDITKVYIEINESTDISIFHKSCDESKLDITIRVKENVISNIYELKSEADTKVQYKYYIDGNSSLSVHKFYDCNAVKELDVIELNGKLAQIDYKFYTISRYGQKYDLLVYHNASSTKSNIITRGVNAQDGSLLFNVTGMVYNGIKDCTIEQNNRIITMNDNPCQINPNLLIEENDVVANHAAHIGKFDQDVIFYLMSRGITYNNAVALLVKGFLTDDSIYKEEIQQIINKYWR